MNIAEHPPPRLQTLGNNHYYYFHYYYHYLQHASNLEDDASPQKVAPCRTVVDEACAAVHASIEPLSEIQHASDETSISTDYFQGHGLSQRTVADSTTETVSDEFYSFDSCSEVNEDIVGETQFSEEECQAVLGPIESFDDQFEEIFSALTEEAKLRNSDCLADEAQESVFYDPVVAEHLATAVVDEVQPRQEREDSENDDPCAKPLYSDAPHTLGVTMLLICCFMIRFRLPDEALSYMLRLITCILPHGHRLMGSIYHFKNMTKRYTKDLLPTIVYHCNNCYCQIEKKSKVCPSCNASLTRSGALAYFLQLKLISQLASLWKNGDFCDMVRNHRFKHFEKNKGKKIMDIYDGLLYQKHFNNHGLLSDPNNISFSLNTDGAPLFKSSNVSIWPVYLLINELPLAQRKKRNHSLFYGVWISSSKPQMWSFLKPLFEELQLLESKGQLFTDDEGKEFIGKCVLLTCTCDLPARALVYNCNQFNGQYSCWHCLQPGQTYKHDSGGISHIFPYDKANPKGPPRTESGVKEDTEKVIKNIRENVTKSTVNGHKGKFWFMFLKHFDMINSCVIDYMHGVCLGIMKTLLTIWFDKKNKDVDSSNYSKREKVNTMLQNITPTMFVSRIPRSLDDLSHWKSSEYRNFLLYWSIPILREVLDSEYFAHFCLLARSIFTLSKEGITPEELQAADTALLLFVENFNILYGDRYLTLNLHQLLHLTDCVRYTGPLYVNNCFIFEDLNGYIVKHIHGTQGIDTQLTNIISMLRVPSTMFTIYVDDNTDEEVVNLYRELSDSVTVRHKHMDEIEDGVHPMGNTAYKTLDRNEKLLVLKLGVRNDVVKEYFRINMYKKGFYVYGKSYSRLEKRQQHVITYQKAGKTEFASVISFIQSEEQNPNKIINFAFIKEIRKIRPLGCIWEVSIEEDRLEVIPIQNIVNVNNFMKADNKCYVCPSPNRYDRD